MRVRSLLFVVSCVLPFVVAGPAGAQGATVRPTAENVLPELQALAGTSIAGATNSPDTPYTPFPVSTTSAEGSEEGTTRLTDGVLVSEVVMSGEGVRSVAQVTADVCPNEGGQVSAKIKMIIGDANGDDRVIEATASGRANDAAKLTEPRVRHITGKRDEAALLRKLGLEILRQSEAGWRKGLCVKVDVAEGGSQTVTPKANVAISATAKPRFGGSDIKGPITSKKTAGQKRVAPATASGPAAKFTYTAPDKTPDTGSVTLTSVSRRGIGTANLEYTTGGDDLRAVGGNEIWSYTGIKCGGPVGDWAIAGAGVAEIAGSTETITFRLAEGTLAGTWNSNGTLVTPVGGLSFSKSGAASYTASSDGKSGTLTLEPENLSVTVGTFCKDGKPLGG